MRHVNSLWLDYYMRRFKQGGFITVLHWITCILGGLVTAYFLLMCYLSFSGAVQDVRKYGGLGFSYPFSYYLEKNDFWENLGPFLVYLSEYLLYIVQYGWAERKKSFSGSIWYFAAMLAIHIFVWRHANSLPIPDGPPYDPSYFAAVHYRIFANITVLPSAAYFVTYSLRRMKKG